MARQPGRSPLVPLVRWFAPTWREIERDGTMPSDQRERVVGATAGAQPPSVSVLGEAVAVDAAGVAGVVHASHPQHR